MEFTSKYNPGDKVCFVRNGDMASGKVNIVRAEASRSVTEISCDVDFNDEMGYPASITLPEGQLMPAVPSITTATPAA